MSLNQILSEGKLSKGLNLNVNKITFQSWEPIQAPSIHILTEDQLKHQSMVIFNTAFDAIDLKFPDNPTLLELLPNKNDYLELTVKYRTAGTITISSVDNAFFVLFGQSYQLEPSNGTVFKTAKIGIGRPSVSGGSFRLF